MNLTSKFGKLAGDKLGRAVLLEPKLGVCVRVVAPRGHVAVKQIDERWDLHDERLHGMLKFSGNSRRSAEIGNRATRDMTAARPVTRRFSAPMG
jgi:hypothetical protein